MNGAPVQGRNDPIAQTSQHVINSSWHPPGTYIQVSDSDIIHLKGELTPPKESCSTYPPYINPII